MDDGVWAGRLVGTDEEFREFVQVRYTDLLRVAYLLTGSAHEAEDLLQSSLLRVMRRWRRVDEPMAYTRRTMVNLHISRWRRVWSRELITVCVPEREVRDPADWVADRQTLLNALAKLPPRARAVIVLRYWVDLSEAETAQHLDCSLGTVKSTASRGLAQLRAALSTLSTSERVVTHGRPS